MGESLAQGWWSTHSGPALELSPGPKTLTIVVDRGHESDRDSMWLRSLILRESRSQRLAPQVSIAYPPNGHEVYELDAVVAHLWDESDDPATAELVIDGRRQGVWVTAPEGSGATVLPLLTRSLSPGPHSVQVRVSDGAGDVGVSAEIQIVVADQAPAERGRYARALHLLNRFAYGMEAEQLADILVHGEDAWLDRQFGERSPGDVAAIDHALVVQSDYNQQTVVRSALSHALRTDQPARARAMFWAENHFSTWIRKVNAGTKWMEHQRFLNLGPASFRELLLTSATSTAMLVYLDQEYSFASRINENYARELLELHTLGVDGGYTQQDVTDLAYVLCGLTVSIEAPTDGGAGYYVRQFRFDPELGDGRPRDVIGQRYGQTPEHQRYDQFLQTLETLAAHPSTAEFVSRKLAEHYVSVPAPDELVEDLVGCWGETGGDLSASLRLIASHPTFWAADLPERFTTPQEYGLHLGRAIGVYEVDYALVQFLQNSGMELFDCETPDGYPEGDAEWTDTNALLQRWKLPGDVEWAVRTLLPASMFQPRIGDPEERWQRVVDAAAMRFLGSLLGEESNRAALEFLLQSEAPDHELVTPLCALICRMPEASLR